MKFTPYMHLVYNFSFFLVGWIFGDWRNWRNYYSTILFLIAGDSLHSFVAGDYLLWEYHGAIPSNHVSISLLIMFVVYPVTVFTYLKYSTKGWKPFVVHSILWVFLYSIIEFINLQWGLISHHHGWNIWWSILMDCILFLTLRLHFIQPLLAWIVFAGVSVFVVITFDIPI